MNEELEKTPSENEEQTSTIKEIINFVLYMAVVFVLMFLVIEYVGQRTQVSGSSMEHTLSDGDNLIVDKISYRFRDPKRYEIIVFPYQHQEKTYYIKRIIGMPGETIWIEEDGSIYVRNDQGEMKLEESYGAEVIFGNNRGIAAEEVVLGEDEYFVLGDNRNASADSRDPMVGKIKEEDIIGRAWIRIFPFDKIGTLVQTD